MGMSRMSRQCRRGVGRGVLMGRARIADRECGNDAAREPGASRTRAFTIRLAYRREDLEGDPARLAIAFVDRHFPSGLNGCARRAIDSPGARIATNYSLN